MSFALYEFMPYGAPDLIEGAPRRLFRATIMSAALGILVYLASLGWVLIHPNITGPERTIVVHYRDIAPPPSLLQNEPPPQIAVAQTAAPPSVGVPVPVPDTQAPQEQTIATQQELSTNMGGMDTGGDQQIVVQPPAPEEVPKLGDYVYADELPELVTDTAPRYPEMAREAGVEGDVFVRVLVGKNGKVADVHVDQSIPMLDQAAIDAARTWVFKPAICNNKPVAVWISRRIHFSLTSRPS